MPNARSAVQDFFANPSNPYVNITRLSNIDDDSDGNSRPITQVSLRFWSNYDNDSVDPADELTSDDDSELAKVVEVTIGDRLVRYALTPVVGAIAGKAKATAMATLGAGYCKVPPLMVCMPQDGSGALDTAFPDADDRGKGMRLHMTPNATGQGDDAFSPGNFGFLDFPYPGPTGAGPNTTLGWGGINPNCTGESVQTRTGVRTPESGALNTRLDINSTCSSGEAFCPSENTTKTWVLKEFRKNVADPSAVTCGSGGSLNSNGNGGGNNSASWVEYSSLSASDVDGTLPATAPGYPEDGCFYSSSCSVLGDGTWDYSGYMSRYHSSYTGTGPVNTSTRSTPTRYDVYQWELDRSKGTTSGSADPAILAPKEVGRKYSGGDLTLYCEYRRPLKNNAFVPNPDAGQKDRRILTVAVVDCTDLHGKQVAKITKYIDLFLIEPAKGGSSDKAFSVEVVGNAEPPGDNNAFQGYAKLKPVLIR